MSATSPLPSREVLRTGYGLEYGKDSLEIHADACRPGERVLIADDHPLMRAALNGYRIPMMDLLVSHGADVNARMKKDPCGSGGITEAGDSSRTMRHISRTFPTFTMMEEMPTMS